MAHNIINNNEENLLYYLLALQSLRLGALLHDVGHLPFSHVSEYALESLYRELRKNLMIRSQKLKNISIKY